MFKLRSVARATRQTRWTCEACSWNQRRTSLFRPSVIRTVVSQADAQIPRRRGRVQWVVLGGVLLGVGWTQVTDSGRTTIQTILRSYRVVRTLTVCIRDYRRTLEKRDKQSDEEYQSSLSQCHQRCANRTLDAMEKNGSVFIKLGQHLTSLNYLLPSEWCDTFIPLQDHCPVSSFDDIRTMVERDTGMAFSDVFDDFAQEPLGAASLAQVHIATDKKTGRKVAVKVQHPILDVFAPVDLKLTSFTFSTLKRAFPEYDLTWLSNEMELSLPQELDFALEGENATKAREYFKSIPRSEAPLVIPEVVWAKRRILVMEYITGRRPDDLQYLDSNNISRDEVAAALARIFNIMIFSRNAPLHCDPHGGNIAIRANNAKGSTHNFDVVLYDHGLYRSIPQDTQRSYAKLWLAVLNADEAGMRRYSYELAGITDKQFPLFASAITGRDYRVVTRDVSKIPRSQEEKDAISEALGDGMLQQLVQLLGQVPRIILLILKTNDLTRSLDTNLQTLRGPTRSFLILAQYAARTVLEEQIESLRSTVSGMLFWPPGNASQFIVAWTKYAHVVMKLRVYEWWLWVRGIAGLENPLPV